MTKRVPGRRRMPKNGPRPVPAASAPTASSLREMLDVPPASESEELPSGLSDLLDRSGTYGGSYGSYTQVSQAADYDTRPYGSGRTSGDYSSYASDYGSVPYGSYDGGGVSSAAGGRDSTSARRDYDWSDFDSRSYSSESYASDVRRAADEASYFETGLVDVRQFQPSYYEEPRAQTRGAAPTESPDYAAMEYGLPEYADQEPETTPANGGAGGQDSPISDPSHAVETSPPTGLTHDEARSVYNDTADQKISLNTRKRSRQQPSEADAEREPAALRLAVLLLPRAARRDWQEEQRRYLLDLPPGRARRAWIVSLVLGLPSLAFATRLRPRHSKESA